MTKTGKRKQITFVITIQSAKKCNTDVFKKLTINTEAEKTNLQNRRSAHMFRHLTSQRLNYETNHMYFHSPHFSITVLSRSSNFLSVNFNKMIALHISDSWIDSPAIIYLTLSELQTAAPIGLSKSFKNHALRRRIEIALRKSKRILWTAEYFDCADRGRKKSVFSNAVFAAIKFQEISFGQTHVCHLFQLFDRTNLLPPLQRRRQ